MLDRRNWRRFSGTFSFNETLPIEKVTIELVAEDAVIRNAQNQDVPAYVTDIHFQAGEQMTGWIPETRELLEKLLHTNDEFRFRVSPSDIYLGGKAPVLYQNVEFRRYNIAGRGIEVFTVPNYYPQDWNIRNVTTGADFEIIPKDDYDFFRICTNEGSLLPEGERYKEGVLGVGEDHPLNMRYTREFNLGAGLAGVPITINASTGKAYRGSERIQLGGVYSVTTGADTIPIKGRTIFLAPRGSVRYRIEFYKFSTRYIDKAGDTYNLAAPILIDSGIGYSGTIVFNQWKHGRSRH